MKILAAYVGVVLVWSTTPLAIKWSAEGAGFAFGVASRMSLGLLCLLLYLLIRRQPLPFTRLARRNYVAGAVQLYGSMLLTYWSAQYLPSGWISVLFGLSPLITALLAAVFLRERSLSVQRVLSYLLGMGGLAVMFGTATGFGNCAEVAVGVMLVSVFLQCASAVWIKRIGGDLPAVVQVTGALLLSVPLYLLTWWLVDGEWPASLTQLQWASIAYLGLVATTFGFALYFYVLKKLPPTRVALITLVTPTLSLWLGHWANAEPVNQDVVTGTALILGALLLHEIGGRRRVRAT